MADHVRIAAASDHAGRTLAGHLMERLRERGLEVLDLGPRQAGSVDYPDFALAAARAVAEGRVDLGLLVCGSGIGMSIAANKVRGIRAALCRTEYDARMSRAHNDANILCLGERVTGPGLAEAILDAFLDTSFEGGRHERRVEKIRSLEGA